MLLSRVIQTSLLLICLLVTTINADDASVKVGVFRVDASPPIGSPVAYAKTQKITDPLSARGVVVTFGKETVVLCAVDWLGIGNEGMDIWRERLAQAAGTTVNNVSIHSLHQHDGCRCDFTSEKIYEKYGLGGMKQDNNFLRTVIQNVSDAVKKAKAEATPVTHLGFGEAKVEKVASNRRILGENGKVKITRWSSSRNKEAIAAPEGLIDPFLKCVSFWNGDQPIAVLTFYATHPQSYYGKGFVTSEFVGIARAAREHALKDLPHIHLNGAGGNITAGKYNDGSKERRPILAKRMETGMKLAWEKTVKTPITSKDIHWRSTEVLLPSAKHLDEVDYAKVAADEKQNIRTRYAAVRALASIQRFKEKKTVNISALQLGNVWLLNMPGELFIEYQLASQKLKPNGHVCMAAYEEYGIGYIGTKISYTQGGYETSARASRVAPEVEEMLMRAVKQVLNVKID